MPNTKPSNSYMKPDHSYLKPYEVNVFIEWVTRRWNYEDREQFAAEFPTLYNKIVGEEVFRVYNCHIEPMPKEALTYGQNPPVDSPLWDDIVRAVETGGLIDGVKMAREQFGSPLKVAKADLEAVLDRRGIKRSDGTAWLTKSTAP